MSNSGRRPTRTFTPPTTNGWLEYTNLWAGQSQTFRNLVVDWTVPAAPSNSYSGAGKVYFTFPGLQRNGPYRTEILQPVLQYGNNGAFGGNYWVMASWICGSNGCWYSTPVGVAAGDSMRGTVAMTACSLGTCWEAIVTEDLTTSNATYLYGDAYGDPDDMDQAFSGAVETYGLSVCSDFPATGVFYTSVSLTDQSGTVSPSWSNISISANQVPNCNFSISSTSSSANLYHNY